MPESQLDTRAIVGIGIIVGTVLVSYLLVRLIVLPLIRRGISGSTTQWDDILLDRVVLHRISLAAPLLVLWTAISLLPELSTSWPALFGDGWTAETLQESWFSPLLQLTQAVLVLIVVTIISAGLTAANNLYQTFAIAKQRPIKSYVQIGKIILWIFGIVIFLAVLTDQEVGYFVTGLGAMTAVLLLVFKDTILSLVASVQLIQNDMLRVGDWIEVPGQGVDGDVMDIALHTVKIRNFDKTVTTVPTHSLILNSFRNWRGMSDSGGRRIKRSILIDMSTIRFLSEEDINRFSRFSPLSDYMLAKRTELAAHNLNNDPGPEGIGDPRRLTNIGTFREYAVEYLRSHPKLHQRGMTLLVRQLQPTTRGLPIELYVFSNEIRWAEYENIQADIFDHLLAILPEFSLRAFQEPSSGDLEKLSGTHERGSRSPL
ncbi:MAG: mechanosensitive ion channel domain-containing protein [Planctomycetaceae bacterium]